MKVVKDRTAFITGGASGIGFGMAQAFLRAGMNVVIADVRPDALQSAVAALGAGPAPAGAATGRNRSRGHAGGG